MATVVFQPDEDKLDIADVDLIITNNGDIINETASTMVTSTLTQGKRNSDETREKQELECQEFTAEEKSPCLGSACPSSSKSKNVVPKSTCFDGACSSTSYENTVVHEKSIFKLSNDVEPINFTEEIQRLLKGEEIKFADDTDSLADY